MTESSTPIEEIKTLKELASLIKVLDDDNLIERNVTSDIISSIIYRINLILKGDVTDQS